MKTLNEVHDIDNHLGIRYFKNHTDTCAADLHLVERNKQGGRSSIIIGGLFAFYYQFDPNELEPISDNHWSISVEVYLNENCTEEFLKQIVEYCLVNTFIREPYFATIKLVPKESSFSITKGRTVAVDFLRDDITQD
jgi:hypothetical protein